LKFKTSRKNTSNDEVFAYSVSYIFETSGCSGNYYTYWSSDNSLGVSHGDLEQDAYWENNG
jgi:hypothetical protein